MLDAAVCWKPDGALVLSAQKVAPGIPERRGNQQATPPGVKVPGRVVLRDYEQRGCDAEDIVQPPQECGNGR